MNLGQEEAGRTLGMAHGSVEEAKDAIFWLDCKARFHRVNDAACLYLGYSQDELLSMRIYDIQPNFTRENWSKTWEQVRKNKAFTFESQHRAKDGHMIPVEISTHYIAFEGNQYSCLLVRVITARKRSERAQQLAHFTIEQAANAIFWVNAEAGFHRANKTACRLYGYSQRELIHMSVQDIDPNFKEDLWEKTWTKIKKEKTCIFERCHRKKFGQIFPVEILNNFIEFEGEEYICRFVRDITERKQAEDDLKNALFEVKQLKNRLQEENIYLQQEIKLNHNFEEIISHSELFKKVLQKVEQVAATDATVLILGETGTGKELLARAVHHLSARCGRPLVKVNCAALPAALIESELFGHEKGAFTGALSRKIGRFELAHRGTLFLDEIGDLPMKLQTKLLRVLQEGEFERLGDWHTKKVNVRVIAASNRNLKHAIKTHDFREDLFYRLNVFPIQCPPLRERKEDIPVLVRYFTKKYSSKMGKKIETIPLKVLDVFQNYHWPGNIRELENIIERACILSKGSTLEFNEPLDLRSNPEEEASLPLTFLSIKEKESNLIRQVLDQCNWVIEGKFGAALRLNVPPSTLRERMKKHGIKKHQREK